MDFLIRASCFVQLWCLQHPNFLTKLLLTILYSIDLIIFTLQGARSFLSRRSKLCGSNYAALGRLIVGEYKPVVELIKKPQQRGPFLGSARLLRHRLPSDFPLFLSDKDAGGTDLHKTLHDFIKTDFLFEAQNRTSDPKLQSIINELVQSILAQGKTPSSKTITPDVQRMVIRYMMFVLLEVDVTEAQIATIRKLFYSGGPTANYILSTIFPFALPRFMLRDLQHDVDEIILLIQNSPALRSYQSSTANHNLNKQQWSYLLMSIIGIAAFGGGRDLAVYVLSEIPADYPIDSSDNLAVELAVLETARRHSPVNIVNVISRQLMKYQIGEKTYSFPEGSFIGASIGLANLDANQFPDPTTFKPDRDNLVSAMLSFNSVGFDANNESEQRTCPGRNVALSMCSDLLVAWRNALK